MEYRLGVNNYVHYYQYCIDVRGAPPLKFLANYDHSQQRLDLTLLIKQHLFPVLLVISRGNVLHVRAARTQAWSPLASNLDNGINRDRLRQIITGLWGNAIIRTIRENDATHDELRKWINFVTDILIEITELNTDRRFMELIESLAPPNRNNIGSFEQTDPYNLFSFRHIYSQTIHLKIEFPGGAFQSARFDLVFTFLTNTEDVAELDGVEEERDRKRCSILVKEKLTVEVRRHENRRPHLTFILEGQDEDQPPSIELTDKREEISLLMNAHFGRLGRILIPIFAETIPECLELVAFRIMRHQINQFH
jgi:hypothetical protein